MGAMVCQITSLTIVYSIVCSGADQREHQSSASLAFVRRNPPVTGEFPAQRASNPENVSIWWRHHIMFRYEPDVQPMTQNAEQSMQCQKLGKLYTGPTYKSLLSFTVIWDVYKSIIPNIATLSKYCLTWNGFQSYPGALKSIEWDRTW